MSPSMAKRKDTHGNTQHRPTKSFGRRGAGGGVIEKMGPCNDRWHPSPLPRELANSKDVEHLPHNTYTFYSLAKWQSGTTRGWWFLMEMQGRGGVEGLAIAAFRLPGVRATCSEPGCRKALPGLKDASGIFFARP